MAQPFLEAGMPVFVDKPLSLDIAQLRELKPLSRIGTTHVVLGNALRS